jgi:hypothetical protein
MANATGATDSLQSVNADAQLLGRLLLSVAAAKRKLRHLSQHDPQRRMKIRQRGRSRARREDRRPGSDADGRTSDAQLAIRHCGIDGGLAQVRALSRVIDASRERRALPFHRTDEHIGAKALDLAHPDHLLRWNQKTRDGVLRAGLVRRRKLGARRPPFCRLFSKRVQVESSAACHFLQISLDVGEDPAAPPVPVQDRLERRIDEVAEEVRALGGRSLWRRLFGR